MHKKPIGACAAASPLNLRCMQLLGVDTGAAHSWPSKGKQSAGGVRDLHAADTAAGLDQAGTAVLLLMFASGVLLCWHPTGKRGAMSTRPADSRRSNSATPPCLLAPGMVVLLLLLLLLAVQG